MGLDDIFDIPGLTELYGPGTGLDCPKHEGIHYWADYYILELLDPVTLEPVPPGETGEMVVTTLAKQAAPLIRYRTHDLTRIIDHPCSCGNILPMHDRILGRSDDMFIFRAVNIYPAHVEEIITSFPEMGSEYQIVIDRNPDGRDYMLVRAERKDSEPPNTVEKLQDAIARKIRKNLMVSASIEIVDYGTLPRSERKTRRVFDNRE
jgi:phenylacetate-CoA ligase